MKAPDPLAKTDERGEPTDDFEPSKVVGAAVLFLAVAPVPLWYWGVGPELGVWELLGLVAGLGVIGAGLWNRRAGGMFQRVVDRVVGS